jgi:hydrophobe/amphiphile efflux-1 (HAE1) family protein
VNLSEPFIRRPIATSLLAAGLLLVGVVAFRFLPIAPMPQIDSPTMEISARLPGADPVTVATSIAAPLERRFAQIAGVSELTSTSTLGSASVVVQFDVDRDIDAAKRDIQAAINAAASDLPANLVAPPGYKNYNPADPPIIFLAVSSDTIPAGEVYNYASDVIMQEVSQIPGVGQVTLGGGQKSAVRVQVDPGRLAAMGLSLENVRTFLSASNANLPIGSIGASGTSYTLGTNDQLMKAADYRPLVAFQNAHGSIRLSDVGTIFDATEDTRQYGGFDGHKAVLILIYKQPGANVIETIDRIHALLPQIKRWMPAQMKLDIVSDRTGVIQASVEHIEITLLISIALVVMVVFLFLRRFWATVIPSITVPLALAGTFAVMYAFGYTLDNLSLMALAVAVGFVVDDAIVVIENIVRYLEAGDPPIEAALKGSKQISFTVLSISLSLVAVFIPLIFMGGIVGKILHEFAVTLTAAILVSAVVSLTLTPMMCGRFLRAEHGPETNRFFLLLERGFTAVERGYERALRVVFRHQKLFLIVTVATMFITVWLYTVISKGFFPIEDTGNMTCTFEGAQDVSFESFLEKHEQAVKIILADPAVQTVGAMLNGGTNQGRVYIQLKPLSERKVDIQTVIARLRRGLAKVPNATLYMQISQDLRVGGHPSKGTYQYSLQGSDFASLAEWSAAMTAGMKKIPHLLEVSSDLQSSGFAARVVIDRDAAARLQVPMSAIDATLYDAFGQRQVSVIYSTLSQHHVILEASPQYLQEPNSLNKIYVKANTGGMVPLSAIAHFELANTSLSVSHQGQFAAVTISFNMEKGAPLGDAAAAIENLAASLRIPPSIHASFQGAARAFEDSSSSQTLLIIAALVTVYVILGILYESLIHPITILSTLPSAGIGALLGLLVTGHELDVVGLIGIILLIGLVKKNAIMMIDFALEAEREHGQTAEVAIFRACVVRFRPIMMTTMAALFGAIPLAFEGGVGAELHQPLGISIIGGLIVSQMLTLFTTPVVYIFLDRLRLRFGSRPETAARASFLSRALGGAGSPSTL